MWFFITLSIYLTLGFRYRILLLGLGIFNMSIFSKNSRISIFKYSLILILIILFLGIIGETRNYGLGLNLQDNEVSFLNAYLSIFKEAKFSSLQVG